MTIADQITRLNNAKAAIKQSIENKGVTVGEDVKLDKYADYIEIFGGVAIIVLGIQSMIEAMGVTLFP